MSLNKYQPHVYVIPEDDADRQLANGFILHPAVAGRCVQVMPPTGGWAKVLDIFESVYVPTLRNYQGALVVMLIDFDGDTGRRTQFERRTPEDLRSRVFVVGVWKTPESLKRELKKTFEEIGKALAQECLDGGRDLWRHSHLRHNDPDLQRLEHTVRPIMFPR